MSNAKTGGVRLLPRPYLRLEFSRTGTQRFSLPEQELLRMTRDEQTFKTSEQPPDIQCSKNISVKVQHLSYKIMPLHPEWFKSTSRLHKTLFWHPLHRLSTTPVTLVRSLYSCYVVQYPLSEVRLINTMTKSWIYARVRAITFMVHLFIRSLFNDAISETPLPKVSLLWRSGVACVVKGSWELCRR
jgi:hypothetical protein